MLTLAYQGHTLLAVPAVHNRAVFAEMVNRCCANAAARPDAIAVELDPAAASAVVAWFRELGIGAGRVTLPCMLGLMRPNRWIHPRYRETALQLQAETGLPLHALPPDVLRRELGYAPVSLLCLNPTDSIIEAVRCAVELGVPVYGIDQEHAPVARSAAPHLRDPLAARSDLAAYVEQQQRQAGQIRDDYSDGRRERVMAARLKALLSRHERVLVTGGLAHWDPLYRLLFDASLPPAHMQPTPDAGIYQRVLVHPEQALAQMELFPAITTAYEAARQPVNLCNVTREDVDFQAQFQTCLATACTHYYGSIPAAVDGADAAEGHHGLFRFTGYLLDLCLLSQRLTPDLATTLKAAQSLLPEAFVHVLTDTFMEFDWAAPADYPELPVIGSETHHNPHTGRVVLKVPRPGRPRRAVAYEDSAAFYLAPVDDPGPGVPALHWQWREEPPVTTQDKTPYRFKFVWPPCENLFYASLYAAINVADGLCSQRRTEPFSDSLYDGIDLKASLRSAVHGEPRLFVRRTIKTPVRPVRGEPVAPVFTDRLQFQPTVFIFAGAEVAEVGEWECLMPGDGGLYEHFSAPGRKLFEQRYPGGGHFAESIHFGESYPVPAHMQPEVLEFRRLHGSIRFGNPCVNFTQSAAWLEQGRFKTAPFVPGSLSVRALVRLYRDRHHLAIDLKDWRSALILFALPYAFTSRRVVIVSPQGFQPDPAVRHEARRRGVSLVCLPLSYFPAERIRQIRQQYTVMAAPGAQAFPPELERIFGQRPSHYQELLPRQIAAQSVPRTRGHQRFATAP